MNDLGLEQKKNSLIYRELFIKANKEFHKQLNNLKIKNFCENKKSCCKIRYTDLSPAEIFGLKQQGDSISSEYIELFLPYGTQNNFNYEKNNQIDLNLNNELALKADESYASLLLSKQEKPTYFYFCRYLDQDKTCTRSNKSWLCNSFPSSVTTILPPNCGYRKWQKEAINKINNEIAKDILIKLKEIENYRKQSFSCKKTGTCCRLAGSEFSFEELNKKALNGDKFAIQFTSIFIPYQNTEQVRQIFPEYLELVNSQFGENEQVHFYHCKHIEDNNLCPIYPDRPDICRDFPSNPFAIMPPNCGFKEWKEDVLIKAMLMHALVEISEFNIKKIEFALSEK